MNPPFSYFGGKRRIADTVWEYLGDVYHYIEPFCGSASVLFGRPSSHDWRSKVETINDIDGYITNFFRTVKHEPEALVERLDWPVSELDLHARRKLLSESRDGLTERLRRNPMTYDVRLAAWWVWGSSCWIGRGWPDADWDQIPEVNSPGIRGVAGKVKKDNFSYIQKLRQRVSDIRILCGDWTRSVRRSVRDLTSSTDSDTRKSCGIFFDPPYPTDWGGDTVYSCDSDTVAGDVFKWCEEHGDCERYKIAVCGYEGAWTPPSGWKKIAWKAIGGYGRQSEGKGNEARERIWFSPGCLSSDVHQVSLPEEFFDS
jgi:DNA adenine methylase